MGLCGWCAAAWAVMVWNSWPNTSAAWAWAWTGCLWTRLTLITFLTLTTTASRQQLITSLNVVSVGKCFLVIQILTFWSELCYLNLMMTNKKWNNYILFYCLVLVDCLFIHSVLFIYLFIVCVCVCVCVSNNSFSAEENLSLMIIIRWLLMLF